MYHKLAGMTGTAETEAGEFWDIYKLDVVTIPTNRPVIRNDMSDRVYKTQKEKFNAVIAEIEAMRNSGRPTLVGTTSVEISEMLSRMLNLRHIPTVTFWHTIAATTPGRNSALTLCWAGTWTPSSTSAPRCSFPCC